MTEKELMRKTKTELVEIILEEAEKTPAADQQTTCAGCKNWLKKTARRGFCSVLVRHTDPSFYCAKAVK